MFHGYAQEEGKNTLQNAPVIVEALFSNRGMTFQTITNKKFQSYTKLGFFSVTNLVDEWGTDRVDDYMTQASVTFDLAKGLSINGGFHLSSGTGIRPSAGLVYSMGNNDWLFIANSRIDITKGANLEGLLLAEYKPKINDRFRLYTRAQAFFARNTIRNQHARSYMMARAGIRYKEFTVGLGANMDYYGPTRYNENSFGAFLSALF